jgi:hypothetical protein
MKLKNDVTEIWFQTFSNYASERATKSKYIFRIIVSDMILNNRAILFPVNGIGHARNPGIKFCKINSAFKIDGKSP